MRELLRRLWTLVWTLVRFRGHKKQLTMKQEIAYLRELGKKAKDSEAQFRIPSSK